jgi:hypothetical protein
VSEELTASIFGVKVGTLKASGSSAYQITQFCNPEGHNMKVYNVCLGEVEETKYPGKQRHMMEQRRTDTIRKINCTTNVIVKKQCSRISNSLYVNTIAYIVGSLIENVN